MTTTTANVEILRQGWLDAASALAPGVDGLPELIEAGISAAVADDRLDEHSLLAVAADVSAAAEGSLPPAEMHFLARRLQRAVYEYLLSLDALPPSDAEVAANATTRGTMLIGAEEVAALATPTAPPEPVVERSLDEPVAAWVAMVTSEEAPPAPAAAVPLVEEAPEPPPLAPEPEPDPPPVAEQPAPEPELTAAVLSPDETVDDPAAVADEPQEPVPVPTSDALDQLAAAMHPLGDLLTADDAAQAAAETEAPPAEAEHAEPDPAAAAPEPEAATGTPHEAAEAVDGRRPRFTLFRRTATPTPWSEPQHTAGSNGHTEAAPEQSAPAAEAPELAEPEPEPAEDTTPAPEATPSTEPFVAPRDGFHLSDVREYTPAASPAPEPEPHVEAEPATQRRPWRVRAEREQGEQQTSAFTSDLDDGEPDERATAGDQRFESDPEVIEARLDIADKLRKRRCDEAAALLQRLAADVGGRALAELALDAGDRCRALGKANAALSCYLAASRADPVHETPLLRLADICIDDQDIDLAVSYIERVTRLRRLRGDDKGALRLYRKIVTIAPYRDDVLALLMRAQATGRFDD